MLLGWKLLGRTLSLLHPAVVLVNSSLCCTSTQLLRHTAALADAPSCCSDIRQLPLSRLHPAVVRSHSSHRCASTQLFQIGDTDLSGLCHQATSGLLLMPPCGVASWWCRPDSVTLAQANCDMKEPLFCALRSLNLVRIKILTQRFACSHHACCSGIRVNHSWGCHGCVAACSWLHLARVSAQIRSTAPQILKCEPIPVMQYMTAPSSIEP